VGQMSDAAWSQVMVLADRDGLGDAERMALAVGCPVHGNGLMDWDADGVFCHACDREAREVAVVAAGSASVHGVGCPCTAHWAD